MLRAAPGSVAWPGTRAQHQEADITVRPLWKVPHGAIKRVTPATKQHAPVYPCLIAGLVEREGTGSLRVGKVENVQAASEHVSVAVEGRAAGDYHCGVLVHIGSVLFQQLAAQRHRAGSIAVVTQKLHQCILHQPIDQLAHSKSDVRNRIGK